jgi:ribosomal protein S18 acetylase RimI-like enzyme
MEIKQYSQSDEAKLFDLLREEEWTDYCQNSAGYKKALLDSITYVAYEGGVLCGYVRGRNDDGFGIYVYDLLVKHAYRGHSYGRMLLERVCADYPNDTVYVMSDVDGYYEKLGLHRAGSVFEVSNPAS